MSSPSKDDDIDLSDIFPSFFLDDIDPPPVIDENVFNTQTEPPVNTFNYNNPMENYNPNPQLNNLTNIEEFPPQNLQSMDWTNIGAFLMDSPSPVNNGELFPNPPALQGNSLPIWPNPPIPFSCSCCHVLRQIIHVLGNNVTKLEIHGTVGMISHAILENRYGVDNNGNTNSEYQMFDFCNKSIGDVREFLLQYCSERRRSGHELIQDPLHVYYETLCIGLFPEEFLNVGDFFAPPPLPPISFGPNVASTSSGASASSCGENGKGKQPMVEEQQHSEEGGGKGRRTSLALQRERTGRLALGDLRGYFNLPMEEAAKKINVCPTVMKKICRREGLPRWPYRKVNSLERKVRAKTIILNVKVGEERERIQAEIDLLKKKIDDTIASILEKNKKSR